MDAENATEREQNRWDRSAPENYRLGNTTLTGVGKLRFGLRNGRAAAAAGGPHEADLGGVAAGRILAQQQRQRLQPAAAAARRRRERAPGGAAARRRYGTVVAEGGEEGEAPRAMPGLRPTCLRSDSQQRVSLARR